MSGISSKRADRLGISVQLLHNDKEIDRTDLLSHLEIGRQQGGEAPDDALNRFLIASTETTTIPRRWFVIHALDVDTIRIDNIHRGRDVCLTQPECRIPPGGSKSWVLREPAEVLLQPHHRLRIVADVKQSRRGGIRTGPNDHEVRHDDAWPNPTGATSPSDIPCDGQSSIALLIRPLDAGRGPLNHLDVVRLLRKALRVVTEAAGSDDYIDLALRTATEIVDLDRAVLMVPQQSSVIPSAVAPAHSVFSSLVFDSADLPHGLSKQSDNASAPQSAPGTASGRRVNWVSRGEQLSQPVSQTQKPTINTTVLSRVLELKTTQIFDLGREAPHQAFCPAHSVVATPIIDRHGRIAAVLYGERWVRREGRDHRFTELEGLLSEALAGAVAVGMARQAAERSQANLSEFFSPRVASMLAKRPEMLVGRDTDVSVLFCDVRGFSAISEMFSAEQTIELINDVLSDLSQCVVDEDGVLVDYVGDELFAMWGAPEAQPDHALRAVAAARQMLVVIDDLREKWRDQLAVELDIGIGINSGPARVGNVGSRLKFKYGVLGNAVNVGSRLQGACKQMGVQCLVSASTVANLPTQEKLRRLSQIRVAGIRQAVEVYQCVAEATPQWMLLKDEYESALADYEAGLPGEAVHRLGRLVQKYATDRPSAHLLVEAARALTNPSNTTDTIWDLGTK